MGDQRQSDALPAERQADHEPLDEGPMEKSVRERGITCDPFLDNGKVTLAARHPVVDNFGPSA